MLTGQDMTALGTKLQARTSAAMKGIFDRDDSGRSKALKEASLHDVENAFWPVKGSRLYEL